MAGGITYSSPGDDWLSRHPVVTEPSGDQGNTDWLAKHPVVPQAAPREDQLLPNAPYDSFDMLAHGATFGLTDPMRAGMRATTDYLFGDPNAAPGEADRGFDFQRRSEEIARGRQQYQAAHPWLSTGADLLGSAAMAPARVGQAIVTTAEKVPALWRQFAASTGLGTVGGAVTGAADNPNDRLGGAGVGAGIGAIGGALSPLAMRTAQGVYTGIRNLTNPAGMAETNALDRLRGIVGGEESIGLPGLRDLHQRITGSDAPMSLYDVSPSTGREMGSLYNRVTAASPLIKNELTARDEETGGRILNWLDSRAATGPYTFQADAQMKLDQQTKAKPLYDNAYMQPPINPDIVAPGGEIGNLMTRPSIQKAFGHARNLALEEGRDPNSMGLTFDMDGNAKFQGVPSWQTLDYVKRGIDRVINDFPRHPITNAIQVNEEGRAVLRTLSEFKDILTRNNPQYGQALQTFSGDQASRNALALGADALTHKSAAEQAHIYSLLDPGDQQFFRLGATNEARSRIANTTDFADETKKLAGSPEKRDKLGLLFDKPEDHADFLRMLKDEQTLFENKVGTVGNSATAYRTAGVGGPEEHPLVNAVPAMAGLAATGNIPAALAVGSSLLLRPKVESGARQFWNRWTGNTPETELALRRLAMAPGPAGTFGPSAADRTMGLLSMPPPDRRLAPGWVPGTMTGVNVPGSVPALGDPIAQFLVGTGAPPLTEAERAQLERERNARPGAPGRLPR